MSAKTSRLCAFAFPVLPVHIVAGKCPGYVTVRIGYREKTDVQKIEASAHL